MLHKPFFGADQLVSQETTAVDRQGTARCNGEHADAHVSTSHPP
jgi:hypothetical protein